jgi:hypothetical protein
MPAMRVSLTARYVSHPTIDFGRQRAPASSRPRLGLGRAAIEYHRPRAMRHERASVAALRSQTSGFSFPTVGRPGRVLTRRAPQSLGITRARRA